MSKIFYLKTTICMGIALFLAGCVMSQQAYTSKSYAEFGAEEENKRVQQNKRLKELLEEVAQDENWSTEIKDKIKNNEISIGMTKNQVLASWLEAPHTNNRSVGSWGVHEQWVFKENRCNNYRTTYLHFENGILTSYSD